MASSVSAAFVAKRVASLITRRGYAVTSQGGVSSSARTGAPNMMLKKGAEESGKTAWIPDPVTGYYRPANQAKGIDAAKLREMLLKRQN